MCSPRILFCGSRLTSCRERRSELPVRRTSCQLRGRCSQVSVDVFVRIRLLLTSRPRPGPESAETMLLQILRQQVLDANLELVRRGLVLYTFGNASGIARDQGLIAIKPSGVPYDTMSAEDIVVTDTTGRVVEGKLRPSSDLATHIEIYRRFPDAGGVAHT